jgi:hypothetical protein
MERSGEQADTPPSANEPRPEYDDATNPVSLPNRMYAAPLAWLVPGLGHWIQGRRKKAVLLFACIMGLFLYGCLLGSDSEHGPARCVYRPIHKADQRLFYHPFQHGIGIPAIMMELQHLRVSDGKLPLFNGMMSPPPRENEVPGPTLDEIIRKNPDRFELGTLYTVVAGLLNLLAIMDVIEGPVFIGRRRKIKSHAANKNSGETPDEKKNA